MVALVVALIYAAVRLFLLAQRVDASILVVNVIAFGGIAGYLTYLTDVNIEEAELFRD